MRGVAMGNDSSVTTTSFRMIGVVELLEIQMLHLSLWFWECNTSVSYFANNTMHYAHLFRRRRLILQLVVIAFLLSQVLDISKILR